MLEFHDEVNEKWMMNFANYRKTGDFPDGLWTNYIEKMIMTDKLQVEVLMAASKASLRGRKIAEGGNVMMQYFHDLGVSKHLLPESHCPIIQRTDCSLSFSYISLQNHERSRIELSLSAKMSVAR